MADIQISPRISFQSIGWQLANTSRSGGVSLTGSEQIVVSPAARWTATATFNVFSGLEDPAALLHRSLIRRGRGAVILLPEVDTRGPAEQAGMRVPRRGVSHGDGARFSDGSGYGQFMVPAALASDATMNSTDLRITLAPGLILLPGMRFSTPDDRMHEVDEIIDFDGASAWRIRVLPWLRADYGTGTLLNFDAPRARMRLASDTTGQLIIQARSLSSSTIDFVEAF